MRRPLEELRARADATTRSALTGEALRVVTDSRELQRGDLFVALRGDRFDGHDFLRAAARKGAVAAIVDHHPADAPDERELPRLLVEDTLVALGRLAAAERAAFSGPVVAITGSSGKTTTKELCADVLEAGGVRTRRSPRSLNNHIGLPLSILALEPEDEALVVELGMNHAGEIDLLAGIARPTVGAIIGVAPAHLGLLGSLDAIAQAKGELLDHLGPGTTAVLNADDARVMAQAPRAQGALLRFGIDREAELRALPGRGRCLTLQTPNGSTRLQLALPGRHLVIDALCAAGCALATGSLGDDALEAIRRGLSGFRGVPGRLELHTLPDGLRVLDDSYNANPSSANAAVQTLLALREGGRAFAVLGDMLELGDEAADLHAELGVTCAVEGLDGLCGLGELSEHTVAAARRAGLRETRLAADPVAAALWVRRHARPGDIVLLKGSRSMRVERVRRALEEAD